MTDLHPKEALRNELGDHAGGIDSKDGCGGDSTNKGGFDNGRGHQRDDKEQAAAAY